jgi:hypothetical protein
VLSIVSSSILKLSGSFGSKKGVKIVSKTSNMYVFNSSVQIHHLRSRSKKNIFKSAILTFSIRHHNLTKFDFFIFIYSAICGGGEGILSSSDC